MLPIISHTTIVNPWIPVWHLTERIYINYCEFIKYMYSIVGVKLYMCLWSKQCFPANMDFHKRFSLARIPIRMETYKCSLPHLTRIHCKTSLLDSDKGHGLFDFLVRYNRGLICCFFSLLLDSYQCPFNPTQSAPSKGGLVWCLLRGPHRRR